MVKVYLLTETYGFTLRDKIHRIYNGKLEWVWTPQEADIIFVDSSMRGQAYGLYYRKELKGKTIKLISLDHVCGFVPDEK
jgi:hypothetical protein